MKSLNDTKIGNSIWILFTLMLSGLLGRAGISLAAENTWTQKADMPTARNLLSTCVVDGKLYTIGGALSATTSSWAVEEYDPASNSASTSSRLAIS